MENIKKGYMLSVVSWENDGDNYRTKTFSGLSKEEVLFYKKILPFFNSRNDPESKGLGNMIDERYDDAAIIEVGEKIFNIAVDLKVSNIIYIDEIDVNDDDQMIQLTSDLGHELMGASDFYVFRVFESASVAYIAEDITQINIDDFN